MSGSAYQFRGLFVGGAKAVVTADFASATDASSTTTGVVKVTVAVPGAALGDIVLVSPLSSDAQVAGAIFAGVVIAANSVSLSFINNTGGTLDLASTDQYAVVCLTPKIA